MRRNFTQRLLGGLAALALASAGSVNAGSPTADVEIVPFGSANVSYFHPAAVAIDGNPGDALNYDPFNSTNQPNFDNDWFTTAYAQGDVNYNDGTVIPWGTGASLPIGYDIIDGFDAVPPITGHTGLATALDTPDSGDRYTTYLRIPISVSGGGNGLVLEYLADDGAAFYLDGNPLVRVNCCTDPGTGAPLDAATPPFFNSPALSTGSENSLQTVLVNVPNGNHMLAVSLHQASSTSSDLGLDFRIYKPGTGRPWATDASGDWADATNWVVDPADNNNEWAVFGSAYAAAHTIWTNEAVSVDGLQFDNTFTYNIAGTGAININDGGLNVLQGNHSIQVNVNLNNNLDAQIAANSSIDLNNRFNLNARTLTKMGDGDLIIGNTANTGSGTLVVNGGAVGGSGVLAGDLTVGGGRIAPSGTVVLSGGATTFTVNGDANVNSGGVTLTAYGNGMGDAVAGDGGTLAFGAGTTLSVVVDPAYTPAMGHSFQAFPGWASITGSVTAPAGWDFNAATGTLTFGGGGLACDLDSDGDCDMVDINNLTNQAGVTLAQIDGWLASAGPARGFTGPLLRGDANLDGKVDAQDLNSLGQNWTFTGTMWSTGDFNGDDKTDAQDLNSIGQNWQNSVPAAAASTAAVPEPASASLLLLASLGLLGLRRRS